MKDARAGRDAERGRTGRRTGSYTRRGTADGRQTDGRKVDERADERTDERGRFERGTHTGSIFYARETQAYFRRQRKRGTVLQHERRKNGRR